ncbi:MAG: hypothetical protein Q8Q62_20835, partial [Mesorhizobium sp.]|nr:hypothetical protein [Mesorhizobium sp.]
SLEVLRNWLADDGLLYIEVPNVEQEAARKMRGRIFHYGHIFNFSPWTFRAAAGLAGFEEHPDSRTRYADQTLGFFRKGEAIGQGAAASRENALAISAAMKAHNDRLLPRPANQSAFGGAVSSISTRLSEIIAARRFGSPREIADHFADRLRQKAVP